MLKIKQKGNYRKTERYLKNAQHIDWSFLDYYGALGVEALAAATPKDTGLTSASWSYKINKNGKSASISFHNSNIQNGVPIAIIIQYGHGTRNGGWVEGRDYINPVAQPIFDEIVSKIWKEVRSDAN